MDIDRDNYGSHQRFFPNQKRQDPSFRRNFNSIEILIGLLLALNKKPRTEMMASTAASWRQREAPP